MGTFLLAAGFAGSSLGLLGVQALKTTGHFEFTVSLAYVVLLGVIGSKHLPFRTAYRRYRRFQALIEGVFVPLHRERRLEGVRVR